VTDVQIVLKDSEVLDEINAIIDFNHEGQCSRTRPDGK
jgi:hypothetical protein